MKGLFVLFCFICVISCGSDDLSNTRAYVEGKVSTQSHTPEEIELKILSNGKVVAQTHPNENGVFVLSGPLFSEGFSLTVNQKILELTPVSANYNVNGDSLSVNIEKGTTYVKFDLLKLK